MCLPEGIVVQPNEKYVRKLIELYDLGPRALEKE